MSDTKLISVEGIDGSGKGEICKFIHSLLIEKNINHVMTKEVGGTQIGKEIKNLLFNNSGFTNKTELLLFLADRSQHLHDVIIPNINKGTWVVSDRYIDSTLAYQGYGNKYFIQYINSVVSALQLDTFLPDLTILLDIPVDVSIKRILKRKGNNRFDEKGSDFLKRVRRGYLELSLINNDRIKVIDANRNLDDICCDIKKLIEGIIHE